MYPQGKTSNHLDIYNLSRMSQLWPGFAELLERTLPTQTQRLWLPCLFKDENLRRRFPKALTEGNVDVFSKFTPDRIGTPPKFSGARKILDYYLGNTALQRQQPLALISGAQRRFLRWLLVYGKENQGFSDETILEFFQTCAENREVFLTLSYLLQPDWQTHCPDALSPGENRELLTYLAQTYGLKMPRRKRSLPVPALPDFSYRLSEELLNQAPFNWQPPAWWKTFYRHQRPTLGVNIVGPFCYVSGIGKATRLSAEALQTANVSISCRDIPNPHATLNRADFLGVERHLVTIIHSIPDAPLNTLFAHVGWKLAPQKYRIGAWAWELDRIPSDWVKHAADLQEIWTPTRYVADAVQGSVQLPVTTLLPGVQVGKPDNVSRRELGLPEDRFLFLFCFDMASTFQRKNPLAVMEAFRLLDRTDAALAIKITRGYLDENAMEILRDHAASCGACLIDELLPEDRMMSLMNASDAYISLHRSEGFGLTLAEAMLLGKPVIATRYSGNLDFMNDDNSLLVDYTLRPVGMNVPIYPADGIWAEPSVEEAARHMRWLLEDRAAANALGQKARNDAEILFSLSAAGQRMRERLIEIAR